MLTWLSRWLGLRAQPADPFARPFGDVAIVPLPKGSILDGEAERSRAENGKGFSARELDQFNRSAPLAGGVDQGSGGNGNSSQGAAAARLRGRERRAY